MNAQRSTVSWGYFLVWLVITFIAIVFSFLVYFAFVMVLGESTALVGWLILNSFYGVITGLAQWSILRQYPQISASWVAATLLGFLISSPVLSFLNERFVPHVDHLASLGIGAALGISLGLVQWLLIRVKISRSELWMVISLLAWLFAGLVSSIVSSLSGEILGPILHWLVLQFFGTVLSVVGFMRLLKRANPPADSVAA